MKRNNAELLSELRRLCHEKATGLVVIRPLGKKLAHLYLEAGNIVSVSFDGKTGIEALERMTSIESGQVDFFKGLKTSSRTPLPATGEILAQLGGSVSTRDSHSGGVKTAPGASADRTLNAESKVLLQAALAEYIGPMASIVCDSDLAVGQSLEMAIMTLAKTIPDPENGRKFVEEARAQLA